ncbi:MAG: hypothetical protein sL5_05270 [Candidatus Mesenet longicola]|uniref:Ankyrin repeat domain-containing protein n=1 Tax=Candidatus Mesenet longicola TaxID=1892558 RepID=A0A8J3HV24_9RICK|nr:MAG: hypothetical protein sGL2_05270 [Candidatus Mesenet longicola]GHM59534.1 MAG: hypothetical protein sL5_05270 [Candidatus Mesenet longicola]
MSNYEYIGKIISNEITPEQLREDIDNSQYEIKNLSYEEVSKVNAAFNFMNLGHSLNTAIIGNDLEIIKLIIEKGGKPLNQEDVKEKHYLKLDSNTIGFTHTLHAAIARLVPSQHNYNTDQERKIYIEENKDNTCKIIELLIEKGTEVVNEPEYSTLHYAVETGCLKLVQLVIAYGAEYVEGKRRSTHSPKEKSTEELAKKIGNKDIIELVSQQKKKTGPKCSELIQSVIKNGTTYQLDKGVYTKKKNKILSECAIKSISHSISKLDILQNSCGSSKL